MQISLMQRIIIWGRVLWALFKTFGGVKCNVLSAEETITEIMKGRSLIRFGDGEFGIYKGKDIHYQVWSSELKECFIKIKEKYQKEQDTCPYLLAVPNKFMKIRSSELIKKRVWASSWAEARLYFKKNFNTNIIYGDAFVFEKKNRELYDKLWKTSSVNKTIIFLHNDEKYAKAFEQRYNKKVIFVKCPAQNTFQDIKAIQQECEDKIATFAVDELLFVVSAGPAGKVLIYNFTNKGYQCIDTGHCWDEPLESA